MNRLPPLPAPDKLAKLSARRLDELEERWYALVCANTRDLINAGFGNLRGSDIRTMAHPLADAYRTLNDSWQTVLDEQKARERWHGSHKPIKRKEW